MFCSHCGKEIPDRSVFCPACGNQLGKAAGGMPVQPDAGNRGGKQMSENGIAGNHLFVRFARDKSNRGLLCELILWSLICFSMLLLLVNILFLIGKMGHGSWYTGNVIFGFFLLILESGLGTLVLLRFRGISILYGISFILGIMLIPYYMMERGLMAWYLGYGRTIFIAIFFALALIAAMGLIVCGTLEFFTAIRLKLAVFICSIVEVSLIATMMVLPLLLSGDIVGMMSILSNRGLLLNSVSYIIICCVAAFYAIFYCKGIIESDKENLFHLNKQKGTAKAVQAAQQVPVGIQCIRGSYQGQTFPVHGEIIIGSQPGGAHIVIQDVYVSKQHCRIRFNAVSGSYEVADISTNGVFLENRMRLQHNVYQSCPRGTVIYLGSENQKYKLL